MKRLWLYRMLLAGLTIVMLPGTARAVRLNLAAVASYHCDDRVWPWDLGFVLEAPISENRIRLIQVRLCPLNGREILDVEVLLRNLGANQDDPVSHSELSRLYRRIGLEKEADHELILARSSSASALWAFFLAHVGLADQAAVGYARYRHLSRIEACAELRLMAEAVPAGTFDPKLATACLQWEP